MRLRAPVLAEDGSLEGEVIVWIENGCLSALEFAWVTDEPPTEMPPAERVRVESR